jgi:hypothetical protein
VDCGTELAAKGAAAPLVRDTPCGSCGTAREGDEVFCTDCGNPLASIEASCVCPNCATVVEDRFCTICGFDASNISRPEPTVAVDGSDGGGMLCLLYF